MITSISWQQYFVAIFILTALYYAYVLTRYYRPEIRQFFQKKKSPVVQPTPVTPAAILGSIQQEPGMSVLEGNELVFAESDNPDEGVNQYEQALEQETSELAEAFREIDDKPQFLNLLQVLLKKYQPFSTEMKLNIPLERVWERYKGKLPFKLSTEDMPVQWN